MLKVKNTDRQTTTILKNAYAISVTRRTNQLWSASFSLPKNDPANEHCTHFNYVEIRGEPTVDSPQGRYYGLYRIEPTQTKKSETDDSITYTCRHVLATLMDDVMDDITQFTNVSTRQVLEGLLSKQTTKNWQLGDVEFERYFHYHFENENGLLAPILSIPQPFDEPYQFEFDTQTYPWTLHLRRPTDEVTSEIRWGKDMISFDEVSDPTEIVNYIIPKGYGEGVNQLTIADVNGGSKYLKDDESIAKWGKKSYIWIDRRFKDAESLKSSAQSLLEDWRNPKISFTANAADLSVLPEHEHERRLLNGVARITTEDDVYYGRIIEEHIQDLSREFDVDYKIANRLDDIADIQADVERKQEVNEAYSQGATNIMAFNYQDNCDANTPALIPFYIDDDVVHVNTLELTFRTKRFRAYSQATKGGGAIVKSTKGGGATVKSTSSGGGTTRSTTSGGGTTATSSSGGGTSKSTASGGGSTQSSSAGGDHRHRMFTAVTGPEPDPEPNVRVRLNAYGSNSLYASSGTTAGATYLTESSSGNHSHSVSIPSHTHSFSTPNHTHNVTIPSHSHDVTIPSHTHEIDLPNHTHEIELPNHTHEVEHKIIELSATPSSVEIRIDGNLVPFDSTSGDRINLVDYIEKDTNGKIRRGRHELTISPDGLARIEADLILRVFIQSTIGVTL